MNQPVLGLPNGLELHPWRLFNSRRLGDRQPGPRGSPVESPAGKNTGNSTRRIERMHERWRAELSAIWAIARREGEALGLIGWGDIDLTGGSAEMVYWILRSARARCGGRGHQTRQRVGPERSRPASPAAVSLGGQPGILSCSGHGRILPRRHHAQRAAARGWLARRAPACPCPGRRLVRRQMARRQLIRRLPGEGVHSQRPSFGANALTVSGYGTSRWPAPVQVCGSGQLPCQGRQRPGNSATEWPHHPYGACHDHHTGPRTCPSRTGSEGALPTDAWRLCPDVRKDRARLRTTARGCPSSIEFACAPSPEPARSRRLPRPGRAAGTVRHGRRGPRSPPRRPGERPGRRARHVLAPCDTCELVFVRLGALAVREALRAWQRIVNRS